MDARNFGIMHKIAYYFFCCVFVIDMIRFVKKIKKKSMYSYLQK